MIDWSTALAAAAVTAVVNFLGWMLLRRTIERLDKDRDDLKREVSTLSERRVVAIEKTLVDESQKRKGIYEGLEYIRLNWVSHQACREERAKQAEQLGRFLDGVLQLERVTTEVTRLVGWVDELSREQISHGKDLSALTQRIENLAEARR